MKILFGKTFGLGNAICAVPAIKALQTLGNVDLLVGNHTDDFGARDVLSPVITPAGGKIFTNFIPMDKREVYDVAIMSIPFDGRWWNINLVEDGCFTSKRVMDGRKRPDNSKELGFSSWKKHEVEYQMENAYELGYKGEIPDCRFTMKFGRLVGNDVYVGMGYKKDVNNFWSQKHWGNENFARLIKLLLEEDPTRIVRTSGDMLDLKMTIKPVSDMVNDPRFVFNIGDLQTAFGIVGSCDHYVGNDTGMAHVAASMDKNVAVIYKMDNAWTKSRPWCKNYKVIKSVDRIVTPEEVFVEFKEMLSAKNQ